MRPPKHILGKLKAKEGPTLQQVFFKRPNPSGVPWRQNRRKAREGRTLELGVFEGAERGPVYVYGLGFWGFIERSHLGLRLSGVFF